MAFLPLIIWILAAFNNPISGGSIEMDTVPSNNLIHAQNSIYPSNLFTLSDAEKVLGEPAHTIDSTYKMKGEFPKYIDSMSMIKKDALTYNSGYMSNAQDKETGRIGVIYFGFEQYPQVSSAKTVYSFYKSSNVNAEGFKELQGIGDEAWFGSSPLFVYARKNDKTFVIKVNKMTSKTSSDQFNLIAKKIAESL